MKKQSKSKSQNSTYLDGRVLLAMPSMGDQRFSKAVIYICMHSIDGAIGIILNRIERSITVGDLIEQADNHFQSKPIKFSGKFKNKLLHLGGPMEMDRGFVLHTSEYESKKSTFKVNPEISLTTTFEIIEDLAVGRGPNKAIVALGYSCWGPGQLEQELQQNGWLVCDPTVDLIFSDETDKMYESILQINGIDLLKLSSVGGHA